MKNHINKYMININNIDNYIHKFAGGCLYAFDTESCFLNEEIKKRYENKEKFNHCCNAVRVYSWAISNTANDYVVYGTELYTFFTFFEKLEKYLLRDVDFSKLSESKLKSLKALLKFDVYVHNLGWDIEFLKYYLLDHGYEYYNSKVKHLKKCYQAVTPKSFHIIENDNITYSANINLKGRRVYYKKKIKGEPEKVKIYDNLFVNLNFLDSFKIMPNKLDNIGRKVLTLDDKFQKLGDDYDYEMVRPFGYKLSEKEMMYLYNDVYILKEFLNQFYLPIGTNQNTASSIAFDKFIQGKYGHDKPYKQFLEDYPDLYDYNKIYSIIKKSYKGGWTQVNRKYKGVHLKNINGTSIDINSSYPAVVRNKPLPYGMPKLHSGYKKCSPSELNILVIEFDKFYNKDIDNLIGEIQVGSINKKVFGLNSTEYIHTNIVDGEVIGTNGESEEHRYRLYIWEFELENILENSVFENYKVIETLTFKSNIGHFADVVDHYTEMKIEGKKEGNNVKTNFAKLMLNSFYGKLASKPERVERKVKLGESGLVVNESTDINYLAEKKYYPAFSSCVTAWARVNLRTQLYKIGYNNVIYFDTDSLYTTLPVDEVKNKLGVYAEYDKEGNIVKILNEDGILDPYILGMWDIEKSYKEFKSIGSKKYIVKLLDDKIVCKCAGVPEETRNTLDFDKFHIGYTIKGKKMKKKVKGGYVLLEGDFQLREFDITRG